MNADEMVKKAQEQFAKLSKVPVLAVIGLSRTEAGCVVSLEGLERKAIPDTMDVIGLYELHLDNEGNLTGFERKKLRKRGQTERD